MLNRLNWILLGCWVPILGLGCAVKQAAAPNAGIEAVKMQVFPRKDIEFYSNQFFLWPEEISHAQISRVLSLSKEMDRLEAEVTPIRRKLNQLDSILLDLDEQIRLQNLELSSKVSKINKKKKDLKLKNQKLTEAQVSQQTENAKSHPDASFLIQLNSTIENLNSQASNIQADLSTLESEKIAIESVIQSLTHDPAQVAREQLTPIKQEDEAQKTKHLSEIMEVVTWYDPQPSLVRFRFNADGSLSADIQGWNLTRDELKNWDFSTQLGLGGKPTIENLTYTEQGGIFEFDVKVYEDQEQTQLRETYSFRIARNKYDSTDGKIYYSGNMKRIRIRADGTTELRRGAVKLVDKNN